MVDCKVIFFLNKTPCLKGSCAAVDCFHLAVHDTPLNMWKDTGQERSDLQVGKAHECEQFNGSPEFLVCS